MNCQSPFGCIATAEAGPRKLCTVHLDHRNYDPSKAVHKENWDKDRTEKFPLTPWDDEIEHRETAGRA